MTLHHPGRRDQDPRSKTHELIKTIPSCRTRQATWPPTFRGSMAGELFNVRTLPFDQEQRRSFGDASGTKLANVTGDPIKGVVEEAGGSNGDVTFT